jgi:hypothetical protein
MKKIMLLLYTCFYIHSYSQVSEKLKIYEEYEFSLKNNKTLRGSLIGIINDKYYLIKIDDQKKIMISKNELKNVQSFKKLLVDTIVIENRNKASVPRIEIHSGLARGSSCLNAIKNYNEDFFNFGISIITPIKENSFVGKNIGQMSTKHSVVYKVGSTTYNGTFRHIQNYVGATALLKSKTLDLIQIGLSANYCRKLSSTYTWGSSYDSSFKSTSIVGEETFINNSNIDIGGIVKFLPKLSDRVGLVIELSQHINFAANRNPYQKLNFTYFLVNFGGFINF